MSEFLLRWSFFIVDVSLKSVLLAAVAGLVMALLRVRNSSLKHAVWLGVLASWTVLPLLSFVVPAIPVPVGVGLSQPVTAAGQSSHPLQGRNLAGNPSIDDGALSPDRAVEDVSYRASSDLSGHKDAAVVVAMSKAANQIEPQSGGPSASMVANVGVGERWLWTGLIVWLAGAGLLLLRLVLSIRVTRRLVERSTRLPMAKLPECVTTSMLQVDIQRASFHETSLVYVPITTGWWRPSILLPTAWRDWSEDKLSHVVAHELSHIRRRDCWTALGLELIVCLYWFHPLAWWLKQRLASLAEECCDDAAIDAVGNRVTYARHLLEIASVLCDRPHRVNHAGLAMTQRLRVERRIMAILDQNRPLSQRLSRLSACLFVVSLVPVVAVTAALQASNDAAVQKDSQHEAKNPAVVAKKEDVASIGATESGASSTTATVRIQGQITQPSGQPVSGAFVGVLAYHPLPELSRTEVLAHATTDGEGRYELNFSVQNPKTFEQPRLMVRADGFALGWKPVDLQQQQATFDVALAAEQLLRLKLIDIQGLPASAIPIEHIIVVDRRTGSDEQSYFTWPFDKHAIAKTGLPAFTSDQQGLLTIPHLSANYGVHLQFAATDKTAPQPIQVNTGASEQRPERDATYRGLVRNFKPEETGTITLAPARLFEGTVFLGDSNLPAANARLSIWSSEQAPFGSMMSLDGKTDANGKFRLNPYPGVRFGIHAHPPVGTAYLTKSLDDLKWESGDAVQNLEIRLPAGMVARGQIVDATTGKPIPKASVQYHPNRAKNPKVPSGMITGWQGIQYADQQGRFEISIPGGAGTLMFHSPMGTNYVLQEKGQQEIDQGTAGGWRFYAQAFQTIDPEATGDDQVRMLSSMSVKLQSGGLVKAKLVDEQGKPVKGAIFTSRLNISPLSPFWRAFSEPAKNGVAEIQGLEPGTKYPVYFLDVRRQLGAVAEVSLDDLQPTVVLKPCATAKARFVDPEMKPVKKGLQFGLMMLATPGEPRYSNDPAKRNEMRADEDFSSNFDQVRNLSGTDQNGVEITRLLVPGATYRYSLPSQNQPVKEFTAEPGKTHDMGEIVVDLKP